MSDYTSKDDEKAKRVYGVPEVESKPVFVNTMTYSPPDPSPTKEGDAP